MAFTKTTISNMALANIGVKLRLTDFDNQGGPEAENCRLFYDTCRGNLLEMLPWQFATQRVALIDIGASPLFPEWQKRYKYNGNFRRLNKIVNPAMRAESLISDKIKFRLVDGNDVNGMVVLTDQLDAVAEFNVDVTNEAKFPAIFVTALALHLSTFLAPPLRVNAKIEEQVNQRFSGWLAEAIIQTQSEQQPDDPRPSEMELARG